MSSSTIGSRQQEAGVYWRGQLFLFEKRRPATYGEPAGLRLLLIFLLLEGVVGPRLALFGWLHLSAPPVWLRVPVLLGLALLLVRYLAKLKFSEIGLYPWREWTRTEKIYFVEVLLIANIIFPIIVAGRLRIILAQPGLFVRICSVFLPYLLWGFYQELMYRGILQTELVRRWGPLRGILVSNSLFAFGPLHFYHFFRTSPSLPTFAGIFVTGLLLGILFWRSGNLWMVGVFHGIGNVYIDGTQHD